MRLTLRHRTHAQQRWRLATVGRCDVNIPEIPKCRVGAPTGNVKQQAICADVKRREIRCVLRRDQLRGPHFRHTSNAAAAGLLPGPAFKSTSRSKGNTDEPPSFSCPRLQLCLHYTVKSEVTALGSNILIQYWLIASPEFCAKRITHN